MERNDQTYYYERAQTELKLAQASELPQAVQAHYTIATRYLDRAYDDADAAANDADAGSAEETQALGEKAQPATTMGGTTAPDD